MEQVEFCCISLFCGWPTNPVDCDTMYCWKLWMSSCVCMNFSREKFTRKNSVGGGWQLHEALCPKHLVLRRKRESSLGYGTLEGHDSNFFPEPAGTPAWFSCGDPRCSLVCLKQNWQVDHSKVKCFHSVPCFLTKAISCESSWDSDCEHSTSTRTFGLLYLFGVINSRGRKPLYIWQLILATWNWRKCCWRQAAISRPWIR